MAIEKYPQIGLVRAVCEELNINTQDYKTIIETGSYKGDGAFFCSQVFENVHSIELSQDLYKFCLEKYKNVKNLHFYNGNSPDEIKKIILKIDHNYILFLDAHGSGGDTTFHNNYGRYGTPIIEELESVKNKQPDVIIIDDYRDYQSINLPEYCKLNFNQHEYFSYPNIGNWIVVLKKKI